MKNEGKKTLIDSNGEVIPRLESDERCAKCRKKLIYSESYDALFCASCNEWREKGCSDPSCYYCGGRPEKPLMQASV